MIINFINLVVAHTRGKTATGMDGGSSGSGWSSAQLVEGICKRGRRQGGERTKEHPSASCHLFSFTFRGSCRRKTLHAAAAAATTLPNLLCNYCCAF